MKTRYVLGLYFCGTGLTLGTDLGAGDQLRRKDDRFRRCGFRRYALAGLFRRGAAGGECKVGKAGRRVSSSDVPGNRADSECSEQDYQNYVSLKDYKRAIQLALAMAQPGRLLNLFNRVYEARHATPSDAKSITGSLAVDEILRSLPPKDLVRLLKFVRDWNTRAKTSGVAQRVLETVVRGKSPNDLMRTFEVASAKHPAAEEEEVVEPAAEEAPKRHRATTADLISLQDLLDGLMPYTERHLNRVERTLVDSYMVDYILGEMDGGVFDLGSLEVDEVSDALEEDMAVDV